MFALQLPLDPCIIGRRMHLDARRRAWIQQRLKRRIVLFRRQRPTDPRLVSPPQANLDAGARTADAAGNLPVTKPFGPKPQYLSNLPHGQPRLGHRRSPFPSKKRPRYPWLSYLTNWTDMP